MKRLILILILTFGLLVAFAPLGGAEMTKTGKGSYKSAVSFDYKVLATEEKEHVQMNLDIIGIVVEARTDSPLHNATFQGLSGLHAINGVYKQRGFIVYLRPDEDKVFATYEATGTLGGIDRKGTFTFVGGTGKCAGIEGGGEFPGIHGLRSATKETGQAMTVGSYHWKLP